MKLTTQALDKALEDLFSNENLDEAGTALSVAAMVAIKTSPSAQSFLETILSKNNSPEKLASIILTAGVAIGYAIAVQEEE